MAETYGIPNIRDEEGKLKGIDHTFDWNNQDITIKHKPLTVTEQQEIEEQGENVEVEYMQELLNKKMVQPSIEGDWSLAEVICYFEGIVDFATGGGGEVMQQAREELQRRAVEDEGN